MHVVTKPSTLQGLHR